jgi:hypothetical protein
VLFHGAQDLVVQERCDFPQIVVSQRERDNMDWVLAELVRMYHNVPANEAHGTIVDLVSKEVPFRSSTDSHGS